VDTAYAVQLKRANKIILEDLKAFTDMLSNQAKNYASTPVIGRTHSIHADITSFGLK
jgi:adenylosuccinate lyase